MSRRRAGSRGGASGSSDVAAGTSRLDLILLVLRLYRDPFSRPLIFAGSSVARDFEDFVARRLARLRLELLDVLPEILALVWSQTRHRHDRLPRQREHRRGERRILLQRALEALEQV